MEMTVNGRDTEQYHHHLGLGLGLSLGMSPVEPAAPQRAPTGQQQCWNGFPASSGEQRTHADDSRLAALACHEMPFLRGIDVNRAPTARGSCGASEDEEPGASSPDSTLSSLSGKRGAPGRSGGGGGELERAGAGSDDEDDSGAAGGAASRKKLRLSKDQSAVLEERFKEHSTLNPKQKAALARQLGLRPRQVEVWFQNRRARTKLKQTEVDCESLKRCCETLTEQNRRLQREVQELRALKLLAPPPPTPAHLYMRAAPPPTTLTMCPSCERVAPSGKPAAAVESRPAPIGPWGPVQMLPVFVGRPAQRS
ncbi:homeobox-leucine zipper protein HOX1-like [Lolium rigidum]|uniref:homeobox-leucine zipper protein HOX1-like n=1 Tax=Lolium rigidum TaxID=89674 RepID=UPI001F5E012D|nr:homeobox-leucine zipper protein HOX1-like [Lolium rigidum]